MFRQTTAQKFSFCTDALSDVEHAIGMEGHLRSRGEDFEPPLLNPDGLYPHAHEGFVMISMSASFYIFRAKIFHFEKLIPCANIA